MIKPVLLKFQENCSSLFGAFVLFQHISFLLDIFTLPILTAQYISIHLFSLYLCPPPKGRGTYCFLVRMSLASTLALAGMPDIS